MRCNGRWRPDGRCTAGRTGGQPSSLFLRSLASQHQCSGQGMLCTTPRPAPTRTQRPSTPAGCAGPFVRSGQSSLCLDKLIRAKGVIRCGSQAAPCILCSTQPAAATRRRQSSAPLLLPVGHSCRWALHRCWYRRPAPACREAGAWRGWASGSLLGCRVLATNAMLPACHRNASRHFDQAIAWLQAQKAAPWLPFRHDSVARSTPPPLRGRRMCLGPSMRTLHLSSESSFIAASRLLGSSRRRLLNLRAPPLSERQKLAVCPASRSRNQVRIAAGT